jgi:DNA-binding beta-propeller fold protein YncE
MATVSTVPLPTSPYTPANYPSGIAIDASGNRYVADSDNHMIRKIDTNGMVTTIAGTGYSGFSDAIGTNAQFSYPTGIAIDSTNTNLYVADTVNHRIRKIVISTGVVSTLTGSSSGHLDGSGNVAQFTSPHGIAIDSN